MLQEVLRLMYLTVFLLPEYWTDRVLEFCTSIPHVMGGNIFLHPPLTLKPQQHKPVLCITFGTHCVLCHASSEGTFVSVKINFRAPPVVRLTVKVLNCFMNLLFVIIRY